MSLVRPPRTVLPKLTDRLTLGAAGLQVSPFFLGMVKSSETVCAAFDAGINTFFLTADLHWPLYESARRGLERLLARRRGIRDEIVVGVASYITQPDFCWVGFDEVLEAVAGLKFIDVAIAGGAYANDFMARLPVYQTMREEGRFGVRAIGATFHDRQVALLAMNEQLVDVAFIRYNPSHFGARSELFPCLARPATALLYSFKSTFSFVNPARVAELGLPDDYWRPTITDYYRFALTRPEIDGLLCTLNRPQEVGALAEALEQGVLSEEEEEYLIELAALDEGRAELLREDTEEHLS